MPKEYQPIEYYLEKLGNPKSYQELLEDYAKVLSKLRYYEEATDTMPQTQPVGKPVNPYPMK